MVEEQGQAIPVEQVLAQLKTRGFEEGFSRTPLRDFRGRLGAITGNMITRFQPPRMEVIYNFAELEVIVSTEPYLAPVAQITLLYSNRKDSGMGILGSSIDKIINAGMENEPELVPGAQPGMMVPNPKLRKQEFLIGKMVQFRMTPGHPIYNKSKGGPVPTDCWECVWVEGFGAAAPTPMPQPTAATPPPGYVPQPTAAPQMVKTPAQQAVALLEGKTEQQWNQAVFNDPIVRTDAALINKILQKQFLAPLIMAGQVTVDAAGLYHIKA